MSSVRCVVRRVLVAVIALAAVAAGVVLPAGPAGATGFGATASMVPGSVFLDDTAGTVYTFTVTNTGTVGSIGSVEISRSSSPQTVVACPTAPAGWTVDQNSFRCRFRSSPGTADDIPLGGSSSAFAVTARTGPGTQNVSSTWTVKVAQRETLTSLVQARSVPPGLTVVAHTFEVTGVVVDPAGPVVPGRACPSGPSPALVPSSGGHTVVVCGRNRSILTLTPTASQSSLSGTLLTRAGSFVSGPVAPSASPVVLGRWVGATAAGRDAIGGDRTLVARIGSSTKRFSPVTTFGGFEIANAAPVADATGASPDEDAVDVPVSLSGTDADGQPLTFRVVSGPSHGSLGVPQVSGCTAVVPSVCTGSVSYTPDPDYSGPDSFTYVVNDGFTDSLPATATLSVSAVNDAPVLTVPGSTLSVREGRTVAVPGVSVSDVDAAAGAVVVTLSSPRGVFTVDTNVIGGVPSGGVTGVATGWLSLTGTLSALNTTLASGVSFTADAGYSGPDQIQVSVNDQGNTGTGGALTDGGVIAVAIGANSPPDFAAQNLAVDEDQSASLVVPVSDDGDPLTASIGTPPVHGTASVSIACAPDCELTVAYSPAANYSGPDLFTLQVADGIAVTERSVNVTVAAQNDPPTNITLSDSSVAENLPPNTVVGSLSTTDIDLPSDSHTYALVAGAGSADNAAFTISGNQLRTAASFDFETKSSYSVRIRTTDSGGATFDRQFTVSVTNVNEAPVIATTVTAYSVPENTTAAVVDIDATDPEGTGLTYSTSGPDGADFTVSPAGVVAFASPPNFENPADATGDNVYAVTVTVSDGTLSDSIDLTVTVTNLTEDGLAIRVGGSGRDIARDVVVDSAGNTIVAGVFLNTVDFDPGAGTASSTSNGDRDVFLAKYSPSGTLLWVRAFGGSLEDELGGLAVDATTGEITIGGYFGDSVDVAPGIAGGELTSAGGRDIYVARFQADGDFVWAQRFGSTLRDQVNAVALDAAGNVYLTGAFAGNVFGLTSVVESFAAKLSPTGALIWARDFDSNVGTNDGFAIAVTAGGRVLVGGEFSGSIDLDPGAGTASFTAVNEDGWFSELDSNGTYVRGFTFSGDSNQEVSDIDSVGTNVVIGGSSTGVTATVDLDPTATDFLIGGPAGFVVSYDASNQIVGAPWFAPVLQLQSIDVDATGNVAATGTFTGTLDFRPLPFGQDTFLTAIGSDVYVVKLDPSGLLAWASAIGGPGFDQGLGVSFGPGGTVTAVGEDPDASDFDPGPGVFTLPGFGGSDIFVARLGAGGTFS